MRGLTLRVTNSTSGTLTVSDVPGFAPLAPGETRDLLYTNEVQNSLEYGRLNGYLISGSVASQFVSGTLLNQAPVGRTFTGASPTAEGTPGLVPSAPVVNRGNYLKADGTWSGVTPFSIGAIPQSLLTAQGDLLVRGLTTTERLPLGTLGQAFRAGVTSPEWRDTGLSGTFAARPSPGAYYSGMFYWSTDLSEITLCYYNGTAYAWGIVGGPILSNITPVALGVAAAGTGTEASRNDHRHAMPTASDVGAVPTARTVSTTAPLSGGGALSGDLILTVATATTLAVGVVQLSTTTPQALGTAAAGTAGTVSDAGHVHAMPSAGDVGAIPTTALTNTTPLALGTAASGSSSDVARVDHVHAMPAFPPAMIPLGGYSTVDGTMGTVAIGGSPYALINTDYDRTGLATTWAFVLGGSVTNPDVGTVVLWDVAGAAAAATITVTLATPVTSHSTTFTAPTIATTYELRASVTGGGVGNYVIINSAAIRITWA